jgi:glutamine amidotransferase
MHVFAHNGDLPEVGRRFRGTLDRPVGDTDSERAFCALIGEVRGLWRKRPRGPSVDERLDLVARFAAVLRPFGPANFLFADGEVLFAHGHRRTHEDGAAPRPPGLYLLRRICAEEPAALRAGGVTIGSRVAPQEVILVASVPLTEEDWVPLAEGEVVAAAGGRVVARAAP